MRAADPDGVKYWEAALQQGVSGSMIAQHMLNSLICNQYVAESLYANYLHRQGELEGIQTITSGMGTGLHSADEYAIKFLASDEYFAQAGAAVSP